MKQAGIAPLDVARTAQRAIPATGQRPDAPGLTSPRTIGLNSHPAPAMLSRIYETQ